MSERNSLRFTVAADGTSLAYQSIGKRIDKSAPLLFTNGFATSSFYWGPLLGRLGNRGQMVTWDLKGHGRSAPARDLRAVSVAACADDLCRVMDAAGIEKATLLGFSFGCQIVLEAWRHFPDRINAIVPILGPYERPFDNLVDPRLGQLAYRAFSMAGSRGAGAMLRTGFYGSRLPGTHQLVKRLGIVCPTLDPLAMQPFYKHLGAIDAVTWHAMGKAAQQHSAADLLETINVPVLLITGGRDAFAPPHLGEQMMNLIPQSRRLHLETATHTGLLGHSNEIGDAVEGFLDSLGSFS